MIKGFLIFTSLLLVAVSSSALPKFPQIREVSGQVWLTGKDGKRALLKSTKAKMSERAQFETSLSGFVKVQIDENRFVSVLGGSEIVLPVVGIDHGEVPVIFLKAGSLRWETGEGTPAFGTALRSDLFEFMAPKGDYIFTIEPARAYAGVKVFKGSMQFSALNGEESSMVASGQQAGFQGVIEGGEIAYDVLLKGKKIPRGKLTPVGPLSEKDIAQVAREVKAREQAKIARAAQAKKKLAEEKIEGGICSSPQARFNECAWVCLGNPKNEKKNCLVSKSGVSCVRRRCNANGEWADEFALDAEKGSTLCGPKSVVAPCDY